MKKRSIAPGALRVIGPLLTGVFLLMSPLEAESAQDVHGSIPFDTSGRAYHERDSFALRHPRANRAGSMLEPVRIAQGFSRRRAEQWQHMAPAEKETMRQRMDQWNQMPPQERQLYQQRYDQWRHLSPDEQRQIDRKLDSWNNLSPSEKEDVRRRFR
jgi:hypothetical protein